MTTKIDLEAFFAQAIQTIPLPEGTDELTELIAARFQKAVEVYLSLSPEDRLKSGWANHVTPDKKGEGFFTRDPSDPVPDANGVVVENALRYILQAYRDTGALLQTTPFPAHEFADMFAALETLRGRVIDSVIIPLAAALQERYPNADYQKRLLNSLALDRYTFFRLVGYYEDLDGASAKDHLDRNSATATLYENAKGLVRLDPETGLYVPYSTPRGSAGLFAGGRFAQDLPAYGYEAQPGMRHMVQKVTLPSGVTMRIAIICFIYCYPFLNESLETRVN